MEPFNVFMMIVIGCSAIAYFIANKLGNKDDILSDSEITEESLNANDSEKTLFPASPEKHTFKVIASNENIVIMKINLWWGIVCLGLALGMAYFCMVKDLYYVIDIELVGFMFVVDAWIFATFFVTTGLLVSTAPFTLKIIFDNDGIKKNFNIRFGRFTILDRTTLIPWSAISHVSYTGKFVKYHIAGFHFNWIKHRGKTPRYGMRVVIGYTLNNYKEGLKYAVKKLPKSIFTVDAKNKLERMGIR